MNTAQSACISSTSLLLRAGLRAYGMFLPAVPGDNRLPPPVSKLRSQCMVAENFNTNGLLSAIGAISANDKGCFIE
jgi:hypothetical protein